MEKPFKPSLVIRVASPPTSIFLGCWRKPENSEEPHTDMQNSTETVTGAQDQTWSREEPLSLILFLTVYLRSTSILYYIARFWKWISVCADVDILSVFFSTMPRLCDMFCLGFVLGLLIQSDLVSIVYHFSFPWLNFYLISVGSLFTPC